MRCPHLPLLPLPLPLLWVSWTAHLHGARWQRAFSFLFPFLFPLLPFLCPFLFPFLPFLCPFLFPFLPFLCLALLFPDPPDSPLLLAQIALPLLSSFEPACVTQTRIWRKSLPWHTHKIYMYVVLCTLPLSRSHKHSLCSSLSLSLSPSLLISVYLLCVSLSLSLSLALSCLCVCVRVCVCACVFGGFSLSLSFILFVAELLIGISVNPCMNACETSIAIPGSSISLSFSSLFAVSCTAFGSFGTFIFAAFSSCRWIDLSHLSLAAQSMVGKTGMCMWGVVPLEAVLESTSRSIFITLHSVLQDRVLV